MALPPLFKYLSVQGARLTLGNRTFKHAKPSDFNDREDLSIQSVFPEETEAALAKISDGFIDVILQNLNKTPSCKPPMDGMVSQIQHALRTTPQAADAIKAELARDGYKSIYDVDHMRSLAQATIREINEFMQGYRVLCVTTHKNSEKMWVDYAENHKGIALRIEPNVAKDSKFQLFRPVLYRERRPPLFHDTLEFVAGGLFANQRVLLQEMVEKIIYTKTFEWRHESEYRLAIPLRKNEKPWDTLTFFPDEITELYLGLEMRAADREDIVFLAQKINPSISIYSATRISGGKLGFDRV